MSNVGPPYRLDKLFETELFRNKYRSYRLTISTNHYNTPILKIDSVDSQCVESAPAKGTLSCNFETFLSLLGAFNSISSKIKDLFQRPDIKAELSMRSFHYTIECLA